MNLHCGATSDGGETSVRFILAQHLSSPRTRLPAGMGPPVTLFRLILCHPVEARSRFTWIRISSEALCVRWGFVKEIMMGLCPAFLAVFPYRRGSTPMS
jgi:hypothetical protein